MERKIAYIGIDERYFKSIKMELEDLYGGTGGDSFVFKKLWEADDDGFKVLLRKILSDPPDILYLDYSAKTEEMLKLGAILASIKDTKKTSIIGLLSPQEAPAKRKALVKKILDHGIPITQIKLGGDPHDPVYDGIALIAPNAVKEPAFVTSTYPKGKEGRIGELIKVNSISLEEIVIESNIEFVVGEIIELETNIPSDVLESKQFEVLKISNSGIYYNKQFRTTLSPCLVDVLDETKYDSEQLFADDSQSRYVKIEDKVKPNFENWIRSTIKQSSSKIHKILIIDHKLSIVHQMKEWINSEEYCIRVQSVLEENDRYIHQYRPNLITFDMEKLPPPPEPDPEAVEEAKKKGKTLEVEPINPWDFNAIETFKSLMEQVKSAELNDTLIIVFNSGGFSSKQLQESFAYPKILTSNDPFTLSIYQQLVGMYRTKHQVQEPEGVIFIDNNSELSEAKFWLPSSIFVINESHMDFQAAKQLSHGTSYISDSAADMIITVIPHKESSQYASQEDMHYALIHSLEPDSRKELRAELIKKKN